jgi:FkbM family methyltransferase
MLKFINFLNKIGFGRGKLKKFNNLILENYLKRNNIEKIDYKYHKKNFILYPLDNSTDNKIITSSKKYDGKEIKYLNEISKNQNSIFLDIGANMGYYSIMASDFGFDKIYAFEPLPKMIKRMSENIKINNLEDLIEIIPFALGDSKKKVEIFEGAENIGGSSIINSNKSNDKIGVNMIQLNDFIFQKSIKNIDALKIDVEGYEDRVLMPFFLNSPVSLLPKLIIIEHSSLNQWKENVINWIVNNNYSLVYKSRGNSVFKYLNT